MRERPAPAQDRSRKRIEAILVATTELLEHVNIEDLSHSDISERADISKASVHYYFPTIADLQLALGSRFEAEITEAFHAHYEATINDDGGSWQDWGRLDLVIPWQYFNTHRPACEALLGPILHRRNRLAGMQYNSARGAERLVMLQRRFVVPEIPNIELVFAKVADIIDAFWSRAYLTQGYIDEETLEETIRATNGYLKNYLPEILTRRPAPE